MNSGSVCFTVEFDNGTKPKAIWAESFRTDRDENWVDFYDAEGHLVSSVRVLYVIAIDRACRPEGTPAPSGTGPFPVQSVPPQRQAPAGPVETAARQAAAVHPLQPPAGQPGR